MSINRGMDKEDMVYTHPHTPTHPHTLTPFATFYASGNQQNKFKRELTLSAAWFRG